jgi:hypothetical protein
MRFPIVYIKILLDQRGDGGMGDDQSIFIEVKQRDIGCLFRRGVTPYVSQ